MLKLVLKKSVGCLFLLFLAPREIGNGEDFLFEKKKALWYWAEIFRLGNFLEKK